MTAIRQCPTCGKDIPARPFCPTCMYNSGVIKGIQTAKYIVLEEINRLTEYGLQNHASTLRDVVTRLEAKAKGESGG
jgi:ABC-type ATPase with predicted acetyltransferase domain